LNLVSNALDACISGSQKTEPEVIISTAQKNGSVLIKVSDNGVGMDEEVKKKLFTSFFSTKGGKGTGLGLLATQKIIQEHQGTIAAQSEKGKGSTFIIELPKAEKAIDKGGQ
jgi:signal transduction histidine kinase